MSECEAEILRVISAQDGDTAIFGCVACGWEERVPVLKVNGWPTITTTLACRKNPPTITLSYTTEQGEVVDVTGFTVDKH